MQPRTTIYYDKDRDYAEIFFGREENYGEDLNDTIMVFNQI